MHQTPSLAGATALEEAAVKEHGMPSTATSPEPIELVQRHLALPTEKTSRSYAAAVREKKATEFKMTVRTRGEHSPDSIKQLLKTNINPGEIKVGVKTFKSCNGGVIEIAKKKSKPWAKKSEQRVEMN